MEKKGSGFWVVGNCANKSIKPPSPTSFIPFFFYLLLLSVTIFKIRSQFRLQIVTEYISVTIFGHKNLEICGKKIRSQFLKIGHKFGHKF